MTSQIGTELNEFCASDRSRSMSCVMRRYFGSNHLNLHPSPKIFDRFIDQITPRANCTLKHFPRKA